MSSIVEVDQSGKFEITKVHTVLAFSNGITFSILIPSVVKRLCITELRRRKYAGNTLYMQLFSISLYLLLENHINSVKEVVLDTEYIGREREIKEHLLHLFQKNKKIVAPDVISFGFIGKKSPAHYHALETWRGRRKPDKIVSASDLLGEFRH